jgi:hypothetical protein
MIFKTGGSNGTFALTPVFCLLVLIQRLLLLSLIIFSFVSFKASTGAYPV